MSELLDISEKLQDTAAAMSQIERAITSDPASQALTLMGRSLEKRHHALEEAFKAAASREGTSVLTYRLIPDSDPKLMGLTTALGDFQNVFSVVYDAQRNGPKQTAKVGAESANASAFGFAYTFPGSVGFVLTLGDRRLFDEGSEFDRTIQIIFELAKADSPEMVLSFAKLLGPAPVRVVYQWAIDHVRFGMSAEIDWERGESVRQNLLIQYRELRKLSEVIGRTSDDTTDTLTIVGELAAADTTRKTFKLNPDMGGEISGKFSEAISAEHTVELPRRYRVTLVKTRRVKFSTDEEEVSYFLTGLEPLGGNG